MLSALTVCLIIFFCFHQMFRIEIKQRDSRRIVAATSDEKCSVVVNVSPFVVDVFCSDQLVVSVNSRSLLRFNIGHANSRYHHSLCVTFCQPANDCIHLIFFSLLVKIYVIFFTCLR